MFWYMFILKGRGSYKKPFCKINGCGEFGNFESRGSALSNEVGREWYWAIFHALTFQFEDVQSELLPSLQSMSNCCSFIIQTQVWNMQPSTTEVDNHKKYDFFMKHIEGMDFPMANQSPWPTLSSLVEYNQTLLGLKLFLAWL